MQDVVLISCRGAILEIPKGDLIVPSKMRWWMNLDTTGDNPVLHDKAITAWKLYQTIITTPKPIPPTFFQKLRARIELKLINWGLR